MCKDTFRKPGLIYKFRASLLEGVYQIHPKWLFEIRFSPPPPAPLEEGSRSGEEGILMLKSLLWGILISWSKFRSTCLLAITESVKRSEQIFGGGGNHFWKTLSLLEWEKLLHWKGSPFTYQTCLGLMSASWSKEPWQWGRVLVKEEGKEVSSRTLTAGREHFSREGANITKILIYPRREFLNLCIDTSLLFPRKGPKKIRQTWVWKFGRVFLGLSQKEQEEEVRLGALCIQCLKWGRGANEKLRGPPWVLFLKSSWLPWRF